ncbi:helix-turn-helix domain-containing protein [Synechococcus sp. 1G10]|uniref:helix-turn-helix domain-containing protein n=1 Tax=Synechococcus sp. 1G10 TaxID=2025605 RepID=UPI000B983870|nr:helix-turn-helix domain-containing protein [Synechococcus sp. 1G10]
MDSPNPEKKPTELILQRSYIDIDDLAASLGARRSLQLMRLDIQSFQANLTLAEFDSFQLLVTESACPLHIVGDRVGDYLDFACILRPGKDRPVSHKIPVSLDMLFGFDPSRGGDLVLPASCRMAVFQIKQTVFEDYLQIMNRSDIDQRFLSRHCIRLPAEMPAIRGYLNQLLHVSQRHPHLLRQPHLQRLVLEDFLQLLVSSLPAPTHKQFLSPKPFRRAELVDHAVTHMRANVSRALTLKDLCMALSTSSRALNYGFNEVFGTSPMAYLKYLRLHSVRRALQAADPSEATVWSISTQFGFWSRGHFASAYAELFGETPSATLAKARL